MKIVYLTPEYPNERTRSSGGIGTSIRSVASGLVRLGHEVRVVVYGQREEGRFSDMGIEVIRVRNVKFKGLSWWLTRKKLARILNRLHSEGRADIVEAPDWTGITAFMNLNFPLVVKLHGSDSYFCHLEGRKVKPFNFFLERKALATADGHASVSRYTAEVTNRIFGQEHAYAILHNGVEGTSFPLSLSSEPDTLLYFGSLVRKKGLLELPLIFNEVVSKRPSARLILAGKDVRDAFSGNPSTWEMMKNLFSPQAYAKVTYLGELPFSEVAVHIAGASICVFPSRGEAFPVSWLEAMAMGKALVVSDIGWAREVVDEGIDGFLADPGDHAIFAARILTLLGDRDLIRTFGAAAGKKARSRFDNQAVAKANVDFYSRFVK